MAEKQTVGVLKYLKHKLKRKVANTKVHIDPIRIKPHRYSTSDFTKINIDNHSETFTVNGKKLEPGTPEYIAAKKKFDAGMRTFDSGMEDFSRAMEDMGKTFRRMG